METRSILRPWKFFYRIRWILALTVLAVVAASIPSASKLPVDPSNLAMFERTQSFQDNERFQSLFGGDDTVVIGVGNLEVLTRPVLNWLSTMAEDFAQWPEIETVENLMTVKGVARKGWKVSDFVLAQAFLQGDETADELRSKLENFHEWIKPFMNETGHFTAAVITLKPGLKSAQRHYVIVKTRDWLKDHPLENASFYLSGTAVEQDSFIARIEKDHHLFVPLTFGLMMLIILFFFGHWLYMIYPAAVIVATIVSTQALMTCLNSPMNVITSLVAPVILIISISDVIHIQSHVRHVGRRPRPERALAVTFHALALPCLLTTLTTMAGFFSLMISRVPAIRQFGFFSGFGTGIALCWTFLLLPVFFLRHIHKSDAPQHQIWSTVAGQLTEWSLKYRRVIILLALIFVGGGLYGLSGTQIHTDILGAFKPDDPFRQDTQTIQRQLEGIYPLEFRVHTETEGSFLDASKILAWNRFEKLIEGFEGVSYVRYLTDVLNVLDRAVRGKDEGDENEIPDFYLEKYIAGMDLKENPELKRVMSADLRDTRLSVFLKSSDTRHVMELAAKIQNALPDDLKGIWQVTPAGQTYLLASMSQNLVKNELWSIAVAMAAIWLMLTVWFRSLTAGLISILVNALALTVMIGSMPFLRIPLNTATATIGSVAVGLIVDHSIHVLYRFKQNIKTQKIEKSIAHVMAYCAQPMICTTFILTAGFAVTLLGSIEPTIQFAVMMIGVLIMALLANLLVLPIGLTVMGRNHNNE
ncbi:MAG: MMPL family transporter [Candidatus Omnitrophica bacterium]|nr:MMPL family transporter [Candidatus Omnitrophota bacterium]